LLIQPDAWIGVEKGDNGLTLVQHNGQTMVDQRVPLTVQRIWLRADCEFFSQLARFSYSIDGESFHSIGEPFRMVTIGVTFQGVRYGMFSFHRDAGEAGFADFDSLHIKEPNPHGITRPIPYGKQVVLSTRSGERTLQLAITGPSISGQAGQSTPLTVVDRNLGRVALCAQAQCISVADDGHISLRTGVPGPAETFQWIETFTGDLTLMSLKTHRYLRENFATGELTADCPGPEPNGPEGVRFVWH